MKKVVLNLKMNLTLQGMETYEQSLQKLCNHNPEVIVCPSNPFLYLFKNPNYLLGSQDVSEFIEGSYTGEVSAKQLASMGVKYTILNHNERNKVNALTDEVLLRKIKNAMDNKMQVLLCIGDTAEEHKSKQSLENIKKRLIKLFNRVNRDYLDNIIIVYEPLWAISSGLTPTIQEIDEMALMIKNTIFRNYDKDIEVFYGGSITGYNITNLITAVNIDGYVVGESSLDMRSLSDILAMTKEKY